ncbi:MAG: hypothetical protein HYW34_01055 [Candidatus Brennerbacteria bacterium]|nr:hypothetical protein [Candidatus Brennerbacteria bacterium]
MKLSRVAGYLISILPLTAIAADIGGVPILIPKNTAVNIGIVANNITRWTAGFIAAIAVLFVIYAAYLYMASAGDPQKVADASKYILWAVIASIVAASAFGIIALAKAIFGFA